MLLPAQEGPRFPQGEGWDQLPAAHRQPWVVAGRVPVSLSLDMTAPW